MPTALILGATSDIGYAIAKQFAQEGYNIQLAGRNTDQLSTSKTDINIRYRVECSTHKFDAAEFSSHEGFYHQLSPKPDVTIYVIGYMTENESAIVNWDESYRTIAANYAGAVSLLNIVGRDYAANKKGGIIGISSVAGNRGRQSNYIYGSAKAGFTAYLSGLRNKLFHSNVHVMTVLPGFVYTKMTEHLKLPKPLTATPEQVAKSVYKGFAGKKNVLYVKWFWRWIMLIITLVPEGMFKKKKL